MSELGLNQIFNVFISHASEDMKLVDQFADVLSWNNINPLVAAPSLLPVPQLLLSSKPQPPHPLRTLNKHTS